MNFKSRNLRELAAMVVGDKAHFRYRSSSFITQFFDDCDLDFTHDGSTRWSWTSGRLAELLAEPQSAPHTLPVRFMQLLRVLMDKSDVIDGDPERELALACLNVPLGREGYAAYYGDDNLLYVHHVETKTLCIALNPHRPFTPNERKRRVALEGFLDTCSEDQLIEEILLPLFRQLGFHRITSAGHRDKALEYGKDIWMRYVLPTQHVIYFGIQAKKGKLDAAGVSQGSNANIAEIYNQVLMMLGHEVFDPDTNKRVLVDHAFIAAGGIITKQARNWLGGKLDATKRSQVMFMDRENIVNLYVVSSLLIPANANAERVQNTGDEIPF